MNRTRNAALVIGALLALFVTGEGQVARSSCVDATDCYCALAPREDSALVLGELHHVRANVYDIVLGFFPYYDPYDRLPMQGTIEGCLLDVYTEVLEDGARAMMALDFGPRGCVIRTYILQNDNCLIPCYLDPGFGGGCPWDVAMAILSDDCRQASLALGVKDTGCHYGGCGGL